MHGHGHRHEKIEGKRFDVLKLLAMTTTTLSPMMMQWQECKDAASDAIVLFRLGDFYEAFHDDAVICSKELELTLTKRQNVPMSGIPSHTLEGYIDKLVLKGYKIAIVDQVESSKEAKGLVKREITRIVTAGTHVDSLAEKTHHYIAAMTETGKQIGIAFFDLSCADARVIEVGVIEEALNELYRFGPKELIVSYKLQTKYGSLFQELKSYLGTVIEGIENWRFDHELASRFLTNEFKVSSLDGFGLKGMTAAINAAGALLAHIKETLRTPLGPVQGIYPYAKNSFMAIDKTTLRHLDLIPQEGSRSKKFTLLHILDQTETPMGGRLLRQWLTEPLLDLDKILNRHDAVEELLTVKLPLSCIRDIERLTIKISKNTPFPRDFITLKNSLKPLFAIKESLSLMHAPLLQEKGQAIFPFHSLIEVMENALDEEGQFKRGYSEELDTLYTLADESKNWMASYQNHLRDTTGIKTLKVGYTKLSGFYIEVSKGQVKSVPDNFQRRQTLTNAERYMAPELKAYEEKITTAEERILLIETALLQELKSRVIAESEILLKTAESIAAVDCLASLAKVAKEHRYTRPQMGSEDRIDIIDGRHPIIETALLSEKFVPNDTHFDQEKTQLMLITGPNMAGKSTYIRQVALIVIMAQMGSFVPAKIAYINPRDKIFSRIGASDDLSRGQSTFMVEMIETAYILHNVSSKSLVVLDEIGRGTSTYDGVSLAWSIAEYLLTTPGKQAKTLFATHYWELTKLQEQMFGAQNYTVAVHESGDQILFLRKIIQGSGDKSYGIHVAKLAGLPSPVLMRAQEILHHLESQPQPKFYLQIPKNKKVKQNPKEIQLSLLSDF